MLFRSTLTFLLVIPAVESYLRPARIRVADMTGNDNVKSAPSSNDIKTTNGVVKVGWDLVSTTTTVAIASKMVLDTTTEVPALKPTLPGTNIINTGSVNGVDDMEFHFSQSCTVLEASFGDSTPPSITTKKTKCFLDICAGKDNDDEDAVTDCVYLQMSGYFGAGAITAATEHSEATPFAPGLGAADKGTTIYSLTGGTGRFCSAKGEAKVSQKGSELNVILATILNDDCKSLWD